MVRRTPINVRLVAYRPSSLGQYDLPQRWYREDITRIESDSLERRIKQFSSIPLDRPTRDRVTPIFDRKAAECSSLIATIRNSSNVDEAQSTVKSCLQDLDRIAQEAFEEYSAKEKAKHDWELPVILAGIGLFGTGVVLQLTTKKAQTIGVILEGLGFLAVGMVAPYRPYYTGYY